MFFETLTRVLTRLLTRQFICLIVRWLNLQWPRQYTQKHILEKVVQVQVFESVYSLHSETVWLEQDILEDMAGFFSTRVRFLNRLVRNFKGEMKQIHTDSDRTNITKFVVLVFRNWVLCVHGTVTWTQIFCNRIMTVDDSLHMLGKLRSAAPVTKS